MGELNTQFLTEWFGISGAIFAIIFGLFKAIWPKIEHQMEIRAGLKKEENRIRITDQQNTRDIIEAVKVTNELVAKNNEAFMKYNTVFDIHVEILKELRDGQKSLKGDMHRRFDNMENKLENHNVNAIKIEQEQSEIVAGLRTLYGIKKPESIQPEKE